MTFISSSIAYATATAIAREMCPSGATSICGYQITSVTKRCLMPMTGQFIYCQFVGVFATGRSSRKGHTFNAGNSQPTIQRIYA